MASFLSLFLSPFLAVSPNIIRNNLLFPFLAVSPNVIWKNLLFPFLAVPPNIIRNNRRSRRPGASQLLHALPESPHHSPDAYRHSAPDVQDRMKVVGHEAKVQYLHLRMMLRNANQTIHQGIAQHRAPHFSPVRVAIRYLESPQQRPPIRDCQRDVIQANALPRRARLLPFPSLLVRHQPNPLNRFIILLHVACICLICLICGCS